RCRSAGLDGGARQDAALRHRDQRTPGLSALRQGLAALASVGGRLCPAQGHLPVDQPHRRRADRPERNRDPGTRAHQRARLQGRTVGAFVITGERARQMRVVPSEVLKRLYARSDRHGLVQTSAHLTLLIAGGWLVVATKGTWWVAPALLLQGI